MKGLTAKEEEIMGFFWEKGPLFVKEMLAFYELIIFLGILINTIRSSVKKIFVKEHFGM